METTVKIREQFSNKQIEHNFAEAIEFMDLLIFRNEYQVRVNGEYADELPNITLNRGELGNLSKNARKNLAKRIHFFDKKESLRSMNSLFNIFFKKSILEDKISIRPSKKELEIKRLRDIYKIMRSKTEEARLAYKKEKGNFYKKKLS
jgi:hypothetical protein